MTKVRTTTTGEADTSPWWRRLFPRSPNFYELLNRQCKLLVEATAELLAYMHTADAMHADAVIELERQGDALKAQHMTALHQAFATPFDREDIYRSITFIDDILNYTKSTVREMRDLKLGPDEHTLAMAKLLHEGARALQQGFSRLPEAPMQAEADAEVARKTERSTEKIYRHALSELFDANHYMATLTPEQRQTASSLDVLMHELNTAEMSAMGAAVGFVVEIMKRREVYRHMSNAADRVVRAGEVLNDIVAKMA